MQKQIALLAAKLENERTRFEQVCRNNNFDTRTRRECDRAKTDYKSRDTTRRNRHDATNKADKNRSEAEPADNEANLATTIL